MIKQLLCSGLFLCSGLMYAQEAKHKPDPDRPEGTTFNQGYTAATAAALLSGQEAVHSGSDSSRNIMQPDRKAGDRLSRPEGTNTVTEMKDKPDVDKP